jgi:5-hydroxyisourate hydrolase
MGVSTHVLDTAKGRPAAGVPVRLERHTGAVATIVARGLTDHDGRLSDWVDSTQLAAGVFRLVFDTGSYLGPSAFYPEVAVSFVITDPAEHYHVPLLLSPFTYTTYRGS